MTLACVITRKISFVRGAMYFIAQLAGATLGSAFVYAVRRSAFSTAEPRRPIAATATCHRAPAPLAPLERFICCRQSLSRVEALGAGDGPWCGPAPTVHSAGLCLIVGLRLETLSVISPAEAIWPWLTILSCGYALTLPCSLADGSCRMGGHEGRHQRPLRWAE